MNLSIYNDLLEKKRKGIKSLAVLIDPDKADAEKCLHLIEISRQSPPDYFLVGGSLVAPGRVIATVQLLKQHSPVPVVLFPGSHLHIAPEADAILFLSLISGRNPDYLIGNHVVAAPALRELSIEVIPTGYMLVNCGNQTTVSYISNTTPLPYDKPDIAVCTAIAGEMLGLKLMYLEGGSGAKQPVSPGMISAVQQAVSVPLIVGGGIRNTESLEDAFRAGADLVVVGNVIEQQPMLMREFKSITDLYRRL